MLNRRPLRPMRAALVAAVVAGSLGPAWATDLPPVHRQGPVAYLSGGVGRDQARAIEAAAARWPVLLEFAAHERHQRHDAFLAGVAVTIRDATHRVVLDTRSDGPFVLARLQPGRYQVQATFDGKTLTRSLQVAGKATARAVFVWPEGADGAQG